MDALLIAFINNNYSHEMQEEIYAYFTLCDSFQNPQAYTECLDIVTDTIQTSSEIIADTLLISINDDLDYMLMQHTVILIPEATIAQKNQLLSALFILQDLEDYSIVINILESFEDDYVKFATILSDLCLLDTMEIISIVSVFQRTILDQLKSLIYKREKIKVVIRNTNPAIIENLKIFTTLYGDQLTGMQLIVNGFIIGEKFRTYFPYIEKSIITENIEETTLNILSVIYITTESLNDPIAVYREISDLLFKDLNQISKVESMIISRVGEINEYRKAEQAKLVSSND